MLLTDIGCVRLNRYPVAILCYTNKNQCVSSNDCLLGLRVAQSFWSSLLAAQQGKRASATSVYRIKRRGRATCQSILAWPYQSNLNRTS